MFAAIIFAIIVIVMLFLAFIQMGQHIRHLGRTSASEAVIKKFDNSVFVFFALSILFVILGIAGVSAGSFLAILPLVFFSATAEVFGAEILMLIEAKYVLWYDAKFAHQATATFA